MPTLSSRLRALSGSVSFLLMYTSFCYVTDYGARLRNGCVWRIRRHGQRAAWTHGGRRWQEVWRSPTLSRTLELTCPIRLYLIVGFTAHASFIGVYLAIVNISNTETLKDDFWILFLTAAVLGVADACWNTFPPLMMSVFFADAPGRMLNALLFLSASIVSRGPVSPFRTRVR